MKLTFIGDVFPADESFCVGFGIHSQFQKNWGAAWKNNIRAFTEGADYVIGNLESPLIDSSRAMTDDFYGHPRFASFLKDSGVNVLNVANNHILEQGENGYKETIQILGREEIKVLGNSGEILYLRENGCCVAIAGFCDADLLDESIDNTLSVFSQENIMAALDAMKSQQADIKIFCFHWGNEYIQKPSVNQRTVATSLIDAGADIIIGHHPHVIQPYEQYKSGYVFYSLGNFCFNNSFQSKAFSIGMLVSLEIDTEKKEIQDFTLSGVKLSDKKLVVKMKPAAFQSYFSKIQNSYLASISMENYAQNYEKERRKRRLIERISMKISLIPLFFSIKTKEKGMLIRNVFKTIANKL